MVVSQLRQFKDQKKKDKETERELAVRLQEALQDNFFNKNVPAWIRWLMMRSEWFMSKMAYQVGNVDNDPLKLVLYRETKKGTKVLAKNF
jgi:hypothetical protein